MKIRLVVNRASMVGIFLAFGLLPSTATAADKLVGIHSARTMSQSMPWIAEEVGLFKKYDLDFQLVYISSASLVTAAMLSGDGEVAITGGEFALVVNDHVAPLVVAPWTSRATMRAAPSCYGKSGRVAKWKRGSPICRLA